MMLEIEHKIKNLFPSPVRKILSKTHHVIKNFIVHGTTDMFYCVEIETITTCNRKCSYCPNSRYERGNYLMDKHVFQKLICSLATMRFSGEIHPHFYGEPLLDKRLPEFMMYIKEKLPKSKIVIFTNGDLLTKNIFEKLIQSGVDEFFVTQHTPVMSKNLLELFDSMKKNPAVKYRIKHQYFSNETPLMNRGGLVSPPMLKSSQNAS